MGGIRDLSDDELLALTRQPSGSRALADLSDDELEALAKAPQPSAPASGASLLARQNEQEAVGRQREEELQAEYGGLGSRIATGVEGLTRALSLGATDAISAGAQALGLQSGMAGYEPTRLTPEAREQIAALNKEQPGRFDTTNSDRGNLAIAYDLAREEQQLRGEANPRTRLLSEVTGAILPAIATAGGSTAAQGTGLLARGAAATPAGLVQKLGARVATGIAGESTGLFTQALAHGTGAALEGGISALSLQAAQTRASDIEDPTQAAENLAWAVGTGTVLGGVLGALGGAGAQGMRNRAVRNELEATLPAPVASSVEQKVAQASQLQAARAGVREIDDAVDLEAGNLLNEAMLETEARPLSAAQLPQPQRGKWRTMADQAAAAGGAFDEAVSTGTQQARSLLDNIFEDLDNIDAYGGIAAKQKANAFNVPHAVDATPIHQLLDGMDAEVNAFMRGRSKAGLASGGGLGALESLKLDLKQNRALITEAMNRGDVGTAYNLLDQGVKSRVGKIGAGTKNEGVRALMETLYDRPKTFLEDDSLWGELAERQKIANPSWANRIQAGNDQRVQSLQIKRSNVRSEKMFRDQIVANDQSIASMLRTMGDDGTQGTEEAVRTWLRSMGRDATDRMRAWGSPELQARAARVVDSVSKIEDVLDRVGRLKIDKLGHEKALKGSTIEMVGQLAANFGPNPISAAIAMGVGAKRKLAQLAGTGSPEVRQAAAAAMPPPTRLENTVGTLKQSMGQRVAQSASALVRGVATGAPVAAAAASEGMLAEQEHERVVQRALALANPGSPETAQLVNEAAQIEVDSPQLADAYASKQLRDANYIASQLPQSTSGAMWSTKPAMDPLSERRFRRTVGAVANPTAALDRIAQGKARPDELETVRTLNPAMFAQFQQSVAQELQRLRKPPDMQTRLRLAYITGLPLAESLAPDNLRAQQAAAQAGNAQGDAEQASGGAGLQAPKKPGASGFAADDQYATNVDRILDRR